MRKDLFEHVKNRRSIINVRSLESDFYALKLKLTLLKALKEIIPVIWTGITSFHLNVSP